MPLQRALNVFKSPRVLRLPWYARFASVPIAVGLAFLTHMLTLPSPSIGPFVFFYVAIVLASWLGGRVAGLLAVLLSAALARMNGYEVARAFRANDHLCDVSLVALTGYASAEDQSKAAEAGFDRHLAKPPDLDALELVLAGLPERHAA